MSVRGRPVLVPDGGCGGGTDFLGRRLNGLCRWLAERLRVRNPLEWLAAFNCYTPFSLR